MGYKVVKRGDDYNIPQDEVWFDSQADLDAADKSKFSPFAIAVVVSPFNVYTLDDLKQNWQPL